MGVLSMAPDIKYFDTLLLEEYKALRAESLRCAGFISNAIWLGITQFPITISTWALVKSKIDLSYYLLFIFILLQSLLASIILLSELWKYARVGHYIRDKIEKYYINLNINSKINHVPLYWESWIRKRRANFYYEVSLFILQIPILLSLLYLFLESLFIVDFLFGGILNYWPSIIILRIFSLAGSDFYIWRLLIAIITLSDIICVGILSFNIKREGSIDIEPIPQ
jgi:hypothetical protein